MKQLAIISGKGGTGKTTVAASLAALWGDGKVLADCDVDASNLPLVLQARPKRREPFVAGVMASIDPEICTGAGECFEACRFEAIVKEDGHYRVNPLACEGCGVCHLVCPSGAVSLSEVECGELFESETAYGSLIHAALYPGKENSGKLVTYVRDSALQSAKEESAETILIDGSPGIGCPVIATLSGIDLALVVTEPTPTGLQGMERVISVAKHFGVPCIACINKADLNLFMVDEITRRCAGFSVPVIGRIPFDRAVAEANSDLVPLVEASDGKAAEAIRSLLQNVKQALESKGKVS